jgi:hypothetical protein
VSISLSPFFIPPEIDVVSDIGVGIGMRKKERIGKKEGERGKG